MFSIVFLSHPQSRDTGDWLHRCFWPARALSEFANVTLMQTTHPEWLKRSLEADILVLLMLSDFYFSHVIEARRAAGKITVYEISDDFEVMSVSNPQHVYYQRSKINQNILQFAKFCDALQFSSPFLAEKHHFDFKLTAVFKNQLPDHFLTSVSQKNQNCPPENQQQKPKSGGQNVAKSPLKIGWAGSVGHLQDVRDLAAWVCDWEELDQVDFRVMAAPELIQAFKNQGIKVHAYSTGTMDQYFAFLADLDVSLVWVGDDDFSQGRSDGKFLEAALQKTLSLCRYSRPYEGSFVDGESGLFFRSKTELHQQLSSLLHDPERIDQLAQNAYNLVLSQRTAQHGARERLAFYQSLLPKNTPQRTPAWTYLFEEKSENLLYAALMFHRAGDMQNASKYAMQAMETGDRCLLLWLVLGDAMRQLGHEADADICDQNAEYWFSAHFA